MKKTLRVYHESGYWHGNGYYERYNAKSITYHAEKFDFFEIDENDNWIKELIRWNRYYKTQNGKKAVFVTKVIFYEQPGNPRTILISKHWAKLMCFVIDLLPEKIKRKRKLWFGL
jgi:hypothetical protein